MALVLEEADETEFWIELVQETAESHSSEIRALLTESRELVSIFSASFRTVSGQRRQTSTTARLREADTRSPDHPIIRSPDLPTITK
jgi:hypothetical protein